MLLGVCCWNKHRSESGGKRKRCSPGLRLRVHGNGRRLYSGCSSCNGSGPVVSYTASSPSTNSRRSTDSGTIDCLHATKMLILSLCDRSKRKTSNQELYYHVYLSLFAILCGLSRILSVCFESTFTGPPLIPTLSFVRRTYIEAEEPPECPCNHRLLLLFIETTRSRCS